MGTSRRQYTDEFKFKGWFTLPTAQSSRHVVTAANLRKRLLAMIAALDRLGFWWTSRAVRATRARLGRSRPSPVRARINSRSNSASPPSTVSIKRPCAVYPRAVGVLPSSSLASSIHF